jgi:hypothetical protein
MEQNVFIGVWCLLGDFFLLGTGNAPHSPIAISPFAKENLGNLKRKRENKAKRTKNGSISVWFSVWFLVWFS